MADIPTDDLSAWLPSMEALTAKLGTDDPVFAQWRDSVPDKNWAMKDLSALRIGYELGKSVAALSALPAGGGGDSEWPDDCSVCGGRPCPCFPPPDAAVGAQGEGVRVATPEEEAAIDAAAGLAKVTFRLPTEMLGELDHRADQEGLVRNAKIRFILADYLSAAPAAGRCQECCGSPCECPSGMKGTAPAAGKVVDAHARELLAVEYERGELFEVAASIRRGNIPAGWKDDCIALRAISAALTRQSVAKVSTRCSICGEPQWNSPSGVTCDNGHGGATPADTPQSEERND